MKTIIVILPSTDNHKQESEVMEAMENKIFENKQQVRKYLNDTLQTKEFIQVLEMSEFMNLLRSVTVNTRKNWFSYVRTRY